MQLDGAEYKTAMFSNCLVKNETHLLNEDFIMPPLQEDKKNAWPRENHFSFCSKGKFVVSIGFNYIQLDLPTLAVR